MSLLSVLLRQLSRGQLEWYLPGCCWCPGLGGKRERGWRGEEDEGDGEDDGRKGREEVRKREGGGEEGGGRRGGRGREEGRKGTGERGGERERR